MQTAEGIVNAALSYIGLRDPILALNEDSVPAIVANIHFESSRNAVLGERWWNFAKGSATLARLNITAPTGWGYAYQLPADLLPGKARYIANTVRPALVPPAAVGGTSLVSYELQWVTIAGSPVQVLVTDHESPELVYTRLVTEYIRWPESAADALAWHLAPKLALGLAVDLPKGIAFREEYRRAIDVAFAEDMNSVRPDPPQASQFAQVRR